MTPCNASGRSADRGGAKIDSAPAGAVPLIKLDGSRDRPLERVGEPPLARIRDGLMESAYINTR
jgi:hypothetical protein